MWFPLLLRKLKKIIWDVKNKVIIITSDEERPRRGGRGRGGARGRGARRTEERAQE